MAMVIDIGLIILGCGLGVFWFSLIFLPLVYGFPRALWWCFRGRAKWRTPFAYLVVPIIWNVILFAAAAILTIYFHRVADFLMSDLGFAIGQLAGVAVAAIRAVFVQSARRHLDADFMGFMEKYLTPNGVAAALRTGGISQRPFEKWAFPEGVFVIHPVYVDTRDARPHGGDRAEDQTVSDRSDG